MNDLGYVWLMSQICRKQALEYTASSAADAQIQPSIRVPRARGWLSRVLSAIWAERPEQQIREMAGKAAADASGGGLIL